jgi:DNA-binding transcriptional regulator GbsR (MarR family)
VADENLLRAVERFSQTLEGSGMPRMAARVFAYVLAEDSNRYTAAELAEGLRVSPAAISGAVRYLVDARLLFKEREPGRRGDLYTVYDGDVWAKIMRARIPLIDHFVSAMDDVLAMIGTDHPGGRRVYETREFFAFVQKDLTAMLDRWSEYRETLPHRAEPDISPDFSPRLPATRSRSRTRPRPSARR